MRAISVNELQRFFERFERTAFNYAFKLTRSREDAEDICQEARIRALRAIQTTQIHANPEAWFLRIIRNCIFDLLRFRRRRIETISIDAFDGDFPTMDFPDDKAQADFERVDGQISEAIQMALMNLDEEQRALIIASVNGEFSEYANNNPEISKQRLRTKLAKAQRSIRRVLRGDSRFVNA